MRQFFHRYFSVSNNDRQWGFFVTSAGHSIVPAGANYPVGHHPEGYHFEWDRGRILEEFALLLVANGEGIFNAPKTTPLALQRGDLLLIPPGMLHRYRPTPKVGWEEYWVTFSGTTPTRWNQLNLFQSKIPLAGRNMHLSLMERFEELIVAARQNHYSPQMLAALAQIVLCEALSSKAGSATVANAEERLRKAADAIRRHPTQFDLQALAAMADMAESTFRRKFAEHFGTTPSHFAQEEIIAQAKRWLTETPLTIRAIAERLDFSSEFILCAPSSEARDAHRGSGVERCVRRKTKSG